MNKNIRKKKLFFKEKGQKAIEKMRCPGYDVGLHVWLK
jgi:hypothetical protein